MGTLPDGEPVNAPRRVRLIGSDTNFGRARAGSYPHPGQKRFGCLLKAGLHIFHDHRPNEVVWRVGEVLAELDACELPAESCAEQQRVAPELAVTAYDAACRGRNVSDEGRPGGNRRTASRQGSGPGPESVFGNLSGATRAAARCSRTAGAGGRDMIPFAGAGYPIRSPDSP